MQQGAYAQVLLANVLVKIGAVFTIALPLVWLGGLLYHCTSGESLQISLFKVYAVLYRAPGQPHQFCLLICFELFTLQLILLGSFSHVDVPSAITIQHC